jgi:hypothetical protein
MMYEIGTMHARSPSAARTCSEHYYRRSDSKALVT